MDRPAAPDPEVPVHRFGARTAVVRLGECCEAGQVDAVIGAVAQTVEADRTILVLDLCEATQVDEAFTDALLDLSEAAQRFSWEVVLVRPRLKNIWRRLESTAIAQAFTHYGSQAGALEYALARERAF
jgi:hypothetical protein